MRLNFFLPYPKPPGPDGAANHAGRLRPALARLGPTWAASPLRRLVQAVCLIALLVLFFYVCWPGGSDQYAQTRQAKEVIDAETFLALDPLVSISAALAAKTWVWSLSWAGAILLVCLVIPRGFCGYVCPLGTIIDLFDWAIGRRVQRFRVLRRGWWVHLKYYILFGTIAASLLGVTLSGFVAAMPILTRAMNFTLSPLQIGIAGGPQQIPPINPGHVVSVILFLAVLGMGLLQPRFWCRYVCPSGAIFSIANLLHLTERKVDTGCINCWQCVETCPFDAIKNDFTTRSSECTFCQTCGGVCPPRAITFTGRWTKANLKAPDEAVIAEPALSRRGFLGGAIGAAVATATMRAPAVASSSELQRPVAVRPPGSVPERQFLQMCARCGHCLQACPQNVLQPTGFEQGLSGLWTPRVAADWSGCQPSCNSCGQVCPTGAIRALPLAEKNAARMGLAVVNEQICLPHAGREECAMCLDACAAAGYNAIEYMRVGVEMDEHRRPIEGTGYLAPVVLADKCVGCGLCQADCHAVNVRKKRLLKESAIRVFAGGDREDRMMSGSYLALRRRERQERIERTERHSPTDGTGHDDYLPDFLK